MTDRRALEPNDLYRLRLVSDPQISPDGSAIAFVLKCLDRDKNDYVSNIHLVDREGVVRQFTSGNKDSAPRWSPDGRWLAFLSGRKEGAQIHLLSTAGGESVALTDRKLGAGVPVWSPDSTAIAFTGAVSTDPDEEAEEKNADKDEKRVARTKILERASYKLDGAGYIGNRRRQIFTIDLASRAVEQLTHGDFHNDEVSWSPDSRHLAFATSRNPRWDVSVEGDIYIMGRTGGEARQVTSGGAFGRPVFSPDGSRIAFIGQPNLGEVFAPNRLFSTTRDGAERRDELGEWDGGLINDVSSDVVHSDDGLCLVWLETGLHFIGVECGVANVYRADGSTHLVTKGRHTVTDFSVAGGTVAYACADATHLPDVYVLENGSATQLTHENDAFLAEVQITAPERFSYTGANDVTSEAWILPPHGAESGKHPLLVYIHGGPQTTYGEAFFFEYQFLAGQGFGVLFPNIHGSSSYGREYQISIWRDWGNLDYADVLAATGKAVQRPWVDEARLGIVGGSYGGYMTNWVLSHCDLFKAGVTERCLSNIVSFMGTSDFGWLWNSVWGVHPEDDVQKLWDMSPIKYVKSINAPLLVIHSERDDRTPFEQGEQMFVALRRLGKETKFIAFPEESHGLSRGGKPSRRVERLGYIRDWFASHL
jgi:acylaminoacyl-peptidase